MGLSKIALIIGGTLLGIGAISGIGAGVVVSQQKSEEVIDISPNKDLDKENKPNANPDNSEMVNDQVKIVTTIQEVLGLINDSSFVIKEEDGNEKSIKQEYAFNANATNLKVGKNDKIPANFEIKIELVDSKNTIQTLNKGLLTIKVLVNEQNKLETEHKELTLTGFKQADKNLEKLLDGLNGLEQTDPKYSLTLNPKTDSQAKFVSLEELNKDKDSKDHNNGLTNWLTNSSLKQGEEGLNGISLEGKVKLKEISEIEQKTYFTLVSKGANKHLKLIKKENNKPNAEILVGEIKTTNLLASNLVVYLANKNETKTNEFIEALKEIEDEKMKYETVGESLNVKVPKQSDKDVDNSVTVVLNPSAMEIEESAESVSLNLIISFGKDDYLTTFDTKETSQSQMLQKAGFSFYLYEKKVGNAEKKLGLDQLLTENNKLQEYFNKTNFITPSNKPEATDMDKLMTGQIDKNNGFVVIGPLVEKLSENSKLSIMKNSLNKNYLVFSSYSYKGIDDSKVLFTPNLSLIHLEVKKTQVGDS